MAPQVCDKMKQYLMTAIMHESRKVLQSISYITFFRFRRAFFKMPPAKPKISKWYISHLWHVWTVPPDRKDAHRKITQIGVIGSSRTLTGSRLATKPILAKSVIWLAGKSQNCRPPNKKNPNIQK